MTGILTELYGRPGSGKTHTAHEGFPEPLHIDTAVTQIRTQAHEIETLSGETGESWEIVLKQHDWDEADAQAHYAYVESFDEIFDVVEAAGTDHRTVVIDNTYDLKALAIKKFLEQADQTWIRQEQYGAVNDMTDEVTQWIRNQGYHVVWVTQTKDEYKNGKKTGDYEPDGPKRADHRCDFRIELQVDDEGRHVIVRKNRYMDPASDEYGAAGTDLGASFSLEDLCLVSGLPAQQWEVSR